MIVLNEVEEAEKIIENPRNSALPMSKKINFVMRYLKQYGGLQRKYAKEFINNIFNEYYPLKYNEYIWDDYLNKISKYNFPLRDIDSVPITQKELDDIALIDNDRLQRLAFTILVLSKINLLSYGWDWINLSHNQIKLLSNSKNCDKYVFHDLYALGYIQLPKKITSKALRYTKLDLEGETVFEVTHITDLGHWYEYAKGEKYKTCAECGKIFKPNNNKQKYCEEHKTHKKAAESFICIDCGREFQIGEGQRKRKRCEYCNRNHRYRYQHKKYIEEYKDERN